MIPMLQHACFECRKSFKKALDADTHMDTYVIDIENQFNFKCPDCSKVLNPMGKSFKAPKINRLKEWEAVKVLYANGFRFIGSGWCSGDSLPTNKREALEFVKDNQSHPLRVIKSS